jgi:hypothetical protein
VKIATAMIAAASSHDDAERRPPPGVGHKLPAMLPQVFEPVADEADDD